MLPERSVARIGTVERILFLKRLPAFAGLPSADLAVVADNARERSLRAGEVLLSEGEPIGSFYCMVDGRVRVTRRGQVLGNAEAGAAVGGYAMFARDPDGIGAVADTDALVLELTVETMLEMLEDHFPILRHLLCDVCRQLVGALRRSPVELQQRMPRLPSVPPEGAELDLVERILLLRHAPPFRHSSISALAELSRGLTQTRLPAGRELWMPGDASTWALTVVSGEVACEVPGRPEPFVAGPGFPVGSLESVAAMPRWFRAETRTTVVGLQGQIEGLVDVLEDNFETASSFLAAHCAWLLSTIERAGSDASSAFDTLYGCHSSAARGNGVPDPETADVARED